MAKRFIAKRGDTPSTKDRRTSNVRRTVAEEYTIREALEIFISAKEAEGIRPRTVLDYRQHAEYFARYMQNDEFLISEITPERIREYVNYLRKERRAYDGDDTRVKSEKGLSVNTINTRLRTMKTMCIFWYGEGMIYSNPMMGIKMMRDDELEEVPGLTDEEVDKVLNSYDEKQFAEWRDKTLVLLLLDTGMRINEAVNLQVEQIDFKRPSVYVSSQIAKNRKRRDIPLSREVAKRLRLLIEETRQYFGNDVQYLFMTAYGEDFSADTFRRRLNRLKRRLDIPRLSPHMFRHTFARNYVLNGGDIFTLQQILDHADIKTTRKYVQMDDEHVRSQHNKFSPVRRLLKRSGRARL